MRIVCVSDTHGMHDQIAIPDGDMLIHAGDATMTGSVPQITDFNEWLGRLPHPHKVVISGNHDWLFQRSPRRARELMTNATYLQDEGVVIEGLHVYGSPWQPWFHSWAFNLQRGQELQEKWDMIPDDTDILITHSPPRNYGDRTWDNKVEGCDDLLIALDRVRPRLHVFGHIHAGYGGYQRGDTYLVNACICDDAYKPNRNPVIVDL